MSKFLVVCFIISISTLLTAGSSVQAQADCNSYPYTKPNPELTQALSTQLVQAGIVADSASISSYGDQCIDESTDEVESFSVKTTDFDLVLPVDSLSDMATLGDLTATVLPVVNQFTPETTPGPEPGLISLTYSVGLAQNRVEVGVTEAGQAMTQNLRGAALMTFIGYEAQDNPVLIRVEPEQLNLTSCDSNGLSMISVNNVLGLVAFDLNLIFNPAVIQVVDADANMDGVQVDLGTQISNGFVVTNYVDNQTGTVSMSVAGIEVSGDVALAEITWQSNGSGQSDLILSGTDLSSMEGTSIEHERLSGTVALSPVCDTVIGMITLQGREDHRDVSVSDVLGQQTITDMQGNFSFNGGVSVAVDYPLYLSALGNIPEGATGTIDLGQLTLRAGDVVEDNAINIFDLSYIANRYQQDDPTADLNGDGIINIFDLSLAAGNYKLEGPTDDWVR